MPPGRQNPYFHRFETAIQLAAIEAHAHHDHFRLDMNQTQLTYSDVL